MNGILTTGELAWLSYRPPRHRDIRKLSTKFWKKSKAEEERAKRGELLAGGGKTDRKLARALRDAKPGEPAAVYCCPLLARKFQRFFISRALGIGEQARDAGIPITLFNPKTAVPFSKLNDIDWRKLNGQLRRRLERTLGKKIVVVGMGEVEADCARKMWQPHHHLVIYGTTRHDLRRLRKAYYRVLPNGIRPMVISKRKDLGGWYAYASKLMTFRKIQSVNGETGKVTSIRRVRLKTSEFRQLMRYLSRRSPTSFVFAMNCSIVKWKSAKAIFQNGRLNRQFAVNKISPKNVKYSGHSYRETIDIDRFNLI
jgi:hypothetical protein